MTVKEALKDLTKKYNITIEVAVDNALDSDKDKGYAINFNYHITKWLGLTKTFILILRVIMVQKIINVVLTLFV